MIEIPLTRGKVALVDDNMGHVAKYKWNAYPARNTFYVRHRLCSVVRETERERCAEMVRGSLAHFEAADRISDLILAAPSPGSGMVQTEEQKFRESLPEAGTEND